jgi:hypothetical protein
MITLGQHIRAVAERLHAASSQPGATKNMQLHVHGSSPRAMGRWA